MLTTAVGSEDRQGKTESCFARKNSLVESRLYNFGAIAAVVRQFSACTVHTCGYKSKMYNRAKYLKIYKHMVKTTNCLKYLITPCMQTFKNNKC